MRFLGYIHAVTCRGNIVAAVSSADILQVCRIQAVACGGNIVAAVSSADILQVWCAVAGRYMRW